MIYPNTKIPYRSKKKRENRERKENQYAILPGWGHGYMPSTRCKPCNLPPLFQTEMAAANLPRQLKWTSLEQASTTRMINIVNPLCLVLAVVPATKGEDIFFLSLVVCGVAISINKYVNNTYISLKVALSPLNPPPPPQPQIALVLQT